MYVCHIGDDGVVSCHSLFSGLVLESVSNRKNGMSRLIYTSARGLQFDTALIRGSGISIRVRADNSMLFLFLKIDIFTQRSLPCGIKNL